MNSFPEDDTPLREFLKQHPPTVPPASDELEDRIMAMVEKKPSVTALAERAPVPLKQTPRSRWWMIPSVAIAATVVAVFGSQTLMPTRQANEAELAEIEQFIENTWYDTVAEQPSIYPDEMFPATNDQTVN